MLIFLGVSVHFHMLISIVWVLYVHGVHLWKGLSLLRTDSGRGVDVLYTCRCTCVFV